METDYQRHSARVVGSVFICNRTGSKSLQIWILSTLPELDISDKTKWNRQVISYQNTETSGPFLQQLLAFPTTQALHGSHSAFQKLLTQCDGQPETSSYYGEKISPSDATTDCLLKINSAL